MKKIDDKIIDRGIELFNQGYKFAQIARELNICEDTIRKHLNNRGYYGRSVFDICLISGDYTKTAIRGNLTLTNEVTF